MKIKFKILGLGLTDKAYSKLPFGRQIEYTRKIQTFIASAKSVHISQKSRSHTAAWKEFLELYRPDQYYAKFNDAVDCRDDSFQVFYTS